MKKTQEQLLADQILRDIAEVNPYHQDEKHLAALWAAGFLSGYIAKESTRDPWVYKKLRRHIQDLRAEQRRLK